MGRRRSKVLDTQRRALRSSIRFRKLRMKARAWECPWCHEARVMFTKLQGSGRLLLIGCSHCQQGERMPWHPTWKPIDYYHFIIDNVHKGTVPVFKYPEMSAEDYDFIREHISLGKVEVGEIVDDDGDDDT